MAGRQSIKHQALRRSSVVISVVLEDNQSLVSGSFLQMVRCPMLIILFKYLYVVRFEFNQRKMNLHSEYIGRIWLGLVYLFYIQPRYSSVCMAAQKHVLPQIPIQSPSVIYMFYDQDPSENDAMIQFLIPCALLFMYSSFIIQPWSGTCGF